MKPTLSHSRRRDGDIEANGLLTILSSQVGGGGGGQGQGDRPDPTVISAWQLEEEASIPELGDLLPEASEMEAETDDIDGVGKCVISVAGIVENLISYIIRRRKRWSFHCRHAVCVTGRRGRLDRTFYSLQ